VDGENGRKGYGDEGIEKKERKWEEMEGSGKVDGRINCRKWRAKSFGSRYSSIFFVIL
jgi:hypothetical protein